MLEVDNTYLATVEPRDGLVFHQRPDGRWKDLVRPNDATAMACIILQIPYRYLPIFER